MRLCRRLPAGSDHLRGVLEAGFGDLSAGSHAGDFVGAGAVVKDADTRLRAAVLLALFDGKVLIGKAFDLTANTATASARWSSNRRNSFQPSARGRQWTAIDWGGKFEDQVNYGATERRTRNSVLDAGWRRLGRL
jgi:hypothetical protein